MLTLPLSVKRLAPELLHCSYANLTARQLDLPIVHFFRFCERRSQSATLLIRPPQREKPKQSHGGFPDQQLRNTSMKLEIENLQSVSLWTYKSWPNGFQRPGSVTSVQGSKRNILARYNSR